MAYYKVCDLCGATLDPGETCDCLKEAKREATVKEIQKKVQATMKKGLCGKEKKKNGKRA